MVQTHPVVFATLALVAALPVPALLKTTLLTSITAAIAAPALLEAALFTAVTAAVAAIVTAALLIAALLAVIAAATAGAALRVAGILSVKARQCLNSKGRVLSGAACNGLSLQACMQAQTGRCCLSRLSIRQMLKSL